MDCRKALLDAKGDTEGALQVLKEQSLLRAKKKTGRTATQGVIEAYVHAGGRIGAMIEVNCETDFVARTDEFKELVHHLAMQVAAMDPQCVAKEELPEDNDIDPQIACLLLQPDIRNPDRNIQVSRFARFELGN